MFFELLRCIMKEEAEYVMREILEGICENHSREWSLVVTIMKA